MAQRCEKTAAIASSEKHRPCSTYESELFRTSLETDDGLAFLRCWNEGNFEAIRSEWPEAPESVFVGADPLHPTTAA